MGMRVGGSSAAWSNYQTSSVSGWQQRQQGVKDLFSALKAGDLTSAQKAFSGIKSNSTDANSPMTKIGTALQAGDLAAAQQAAQAMQDNRGGHHHHGSHAMGSSSTPQALLNSTDQTVSTATDPAVAFNTFMQNLEAALEQQGGATGQSNQLASTPALPVANASTSCTLSAGATAQGYLNSRNGTFAPPSNAQLEASLESLIQQMSSTAGVTPNDSTGAASTSSESNNLQSSFANLIGAMGGQSATASVTNFLQSLDDKLKSMDASASVVNTTA